ncbi:MAG: alpha-N-acetylglucosaminidase [Alloprevotella sp.]|nr:alpha-N-acetylglucosaminidase [Alloprevotella sp.]
MIKRAISSILFAVVALVAHADAIHDLLGRILPEGDDARKFEYVLTNAEQGNTQQFAIQCDGQRVHVEGTDYVAVATGINWYLQHYAGVDISWNAPTGRLPETLPTCEREVHTASVPWRYYLNFCTHSYSMAFWGWERWQQEIDWMALHGVNMPLAIVGMESVWRDVLETGYGYTNLEAVNEFVCGAAYYGWFFMNNLTAWGGPQPASWYEQREALARSIFQRMTDFGMQPVVPGYVGMVPKNFLARAAKDKTAAWKSSDIVDGGTWCSFTRPAFVNNTSCLEEFAAAYYAAFERLYGDVCRTHFYAIDPFHEGGVPSGVTSAQSSVRSMWTALQAYDKDAVWVCQHWQDNPTTIVTHTIPRGRLIILDLHGDNQGDTSCSGQHTTSAGENHDWVWGQVSNFGGNVGLFGRMDRLIECFYKARDNAATNKLVGIGALPEGIENNTMLYDLLYALPWTTEDLTREAWLKEYVFLRYGATAGTETHDALLTAWRKLGEGVYNCPNNRQQGTTESAFLQRPALKPTTVSSWANSTWYWDMTELRTALYAMLSVSDELKDNENYRYDLVDLMRQALADMGKQTLDSITSASGTQRDAIAGRFLQLILDQDRLLGTRQEFRLGRWTEMARALGTTADEKTLYEKNARMLLTTWGDRAQCESGGLHDYANREWQGLLSSYYYPRWKAFFQKGYAAQSWFQNYEWPFACGTTGQNTAYLPAGAPYAYGSFSAEAEGDEIAVVKELYQKYFADFSPEVWVQCVPDFGTVYTLTNAETWRFDADMEGLCLTPPNSDFNAYRLKRAKLPTDPTTDLSYQWSFIPAQNTDGAVRLQSEQLESLERAALLCSNKATASYPAFTFSSKGTDFYLYRSGDRYYLQEVGKDVFMAPDCAWAEACVLVSNTRGATSLLHLRPVTTGIANVSTSAPTPSTIFDLQGRRLAKPRRGVNILHSGTGTTKVLMR